MIANIIDNRKRRYRWKSVQAIIEAAEHDNCCADSDQAEAGDPDNYIVYDERDRISVSEAVVWAEEVNYSVTLYLYDEGTN